MKVAMLDKSLGKLFWSHVNEDPLNFYFFILDVKLRPDQTRIWLAMEDRKIEGLLLIYRDYVVQLRGSRKAVGLLLNQVTLEKVDLQAPLGYDDVIFDKYRPKLREEIVLMRLSKGDEKIQITTTPERLGVEDAEEISQIMRNEDSVWWGDSTAERLKQGFTDSSARFISLLCDDKFPALRCLSNGKNLAN